MGEKIKTRKLRKWLVLPLTAALMASPLLWPADTALASEALDAPEVVGSAETAGNAEIEAEVSAEMEAAVPEELGTDPTVLEAGEESLDAVGGETELDEGSSAENAAEEPDLEEAQPEAGLPAEEPETAQALDDGSTTYAGNIIASGTDGYITWTLNTEGLLTISGTGNWNSNPKYDTNLWGPYRDSITSAKVNVTGMSSAANMFYGCYNLKNVDLSGFDTSYVVWMEGMFYGCSSLTSLDLSGFKTSKVERMGRFAPDGMLEGGGGMFAGCSSLTSLDLSSFDTSKVTDMGDMFRGCSSLTSLNLSSFDTSKVTGMGGMFKGCSSLTSLDLSSFDTGNVTVMWDMFKGCSSLTALDLSGFDTNNVGRMYDMFGYCSGLKSLNLSGFGNSNVTDMMGMFKGCSSLASLDLSGFGTGNVRDMSEMFYGCGSLTSLDLSGFDTSSVGSMSEMFGDCSSLTSLDLSGFDTSNVIKMGGMFSGCSGLISLNLSGFDTSNVTSMGNMFFGCSGLTSLDLSGFDTSNVTSMGTMFGSCSSLTSLDLSSFDTSNVTFMEGMFTDCSGLTSLDLSGFNTDKVTTSLKEMFKGCSSLTSLDLSGFDTSNVIMMREMFGGCSGLTSLNVSSFDTSGVTDMGGMFSGCSSLTSLDLSKFNMRNVTETEYQYIPKLVDMLAGCDKLVTIDAPLYLRQSVRTPVVVNTVWRLPDSTEVMELPLNLTESIRLSRESVITVEAPTCEISDYIGGKEVTFRSATQDAVIYYSSKAEITDKDNKVKNGGKVKFENFSGTLYARSYADGQWSTETTQVKLNIPKVATPTITKSGNKVVIKAPTKGSTIYYTTDGRVPTLQNGKKADGGSVTIDTLSGTVKAIAVKSGYTNSAMARTVLLNSTKSRNVSFVVKGVFGGRNVTFNSETKGAKVYYSATTSTLTTKDKCVNAGDTILFENFYGTIYARTYYNGEWGNVCRLILKIPVVNTPTISVDSKGYATIKTTTPKCRIYYTTDGSTPSMKNGKMVASSYVRVYVGKGKTVKAIAVRSCFTHSKVATGKSN